MLREVDDIKTLRSKIFEFVKRELENLPPVELLNKSIKIENVRYVLPKNKTLEEYYNDLDEKDAILNNKSLVVPAKADFVLYEDGKPIGKKTVTVCNVPYLTDRGTFILRGINYSLANQLRLKPGIYPRITNTGEVSAMANPEVGQNFNIYYIPDEGTFYFKVKRGEFPLYPLLKEMGVDDNQLAAIWGKAVLEKNKNLPKRDVTRFVNFLRQHGNTDGEKLLNFFNNLRFAPEVIKFLIGREKTNLSPEDILAVTRKLMDIAEGEEYVIRDNLPFQRVITPAKFLAESIKFANFDYRKGVFKALMKKDINLVKPRIFDQAIDATFRLTGLGQVLQDINPSERLDQIYRISKMGRGSIENMEQATTESRNVQPTFVGYIDPLQTPENEKIGVDIRLARGVLIDDENGLLYRKMRNVKTGKEELVSSNDLFNYKIAFPDEMKQNSEFVKGIYRGKLMYLPKKEIDYEIMSFNDYFSVVSGSIPIIGSSFPQRISMGSRMKTQALPLIYREPPLVSAKFGDKSYEDLSENLRGVKRAPDSGVVQKITSTEMVIKTDSGNLIKIPYINTVPNNNKTGFYHIPTKKVGERVNKGDIIFYTNFSSPDGSESVGVNAKIAFIPYYGLNVDDAVVISESFAKKLTSEHFYQEEFNLEKGLVLSKNRYKAAFPDKVDNSILDNYDEDGVIKVGTKVKSGQPLILSFLPPFTKKSRADRIARSIAIDKSLVWNDAYDGEVVDVIRGRNFIKVIVKTLQPAEIGDKLAGRFGDKGVISYIVPDHLMIKDSDGKPFDLIFSPTGLPSRGNVSQVFEMALGKVAAKTGNKYRLDHWFPEGAVNFVESEMRKYNIPEKETIFDPISGREIPNVFTGYKYLMKLHITAESKMKSRSIGAYSMEGIPTKSKDESARFLGLLDLNALLSHGAFNVIHDYKVIRGQRQEGFWNRILKGYNPIIEKESFVYEKFLNLLKGAGINPYNKNEQINLFALTDKDIDTLTQNRIITNNALVDFDKEDLPPIPGGLFDPNKTGGHNGRLWAKIPLPIKLPSPVMEPVLRTILGINEEEFENIIARKSNIPKTSLTGPEGLYEYFSKHYNIDEDIRESLKIVDDPSTPPSKLDKTIKKLKYLYNLKLFKQNLSDIFWSAVPVVPPAFRPVALLPDNNVPVVDDLNYLYSKMIEAVEVYKRLKEQKIDLDDETLNLYKSLKVIVGLSDPIGKFERKQQLKGILLTLFGKRGKLGYFQKKVLSTGTDYSGQGVIIPDPNLSMDQVGIPEDMAWGMYKMFILKNLVDRGYRLSDALKEYENRSDSARKALLDAMASRPVLFKRDPVLHRYGVMALEPVLVKGHVLRFNPVLAKLYGADFDGNCVSGDSEIYLKLNLSLLKKSNFGREFLRRFNFIDKKTVNKKLSIFKIKIKDFPVVSEFSIERNKTVIYNVPLGVLTPSLLHSEKFEEVSFEQIRNFIVEKNCELVRVFLDNGMHFDVSSNESLLTLAGYIDIEKTKPADSIGKKCLVMNFNVFKNLEKSKSFIRSNIPISWNDYEKDFPVIVKVESLGIHDVYDVVIPPTKNFFISVGEEGTDAILVSDTMAVHVIFSDKAAQEAREKMLPSKNLFYPQTFGLTYTPSAEFSYGIWEAGTGEDTTKSVRINKNENPEKYLREPNIHVKTRAVLQ